MSRTRKFPIPHFQVGFVYRRQERFRQYVYKSVSLYLLWIFLRQNAKGIWTPPGCNEAKYLQTGPQCILSFCGSEGQKDNVYSSHNFLRRNVKPRGWQLWDQQRHGSAPDLDHPPTLPGPVPPFLTVCRVAGVLCGHLDSSQPWSPAPATNWPANLLLKPNHYSETVISGFMSWMERQIKSAGTMESILGSLLKRNDSLILLNKSPRSYQQYFNMAKYLQKGNTLRRFVSIKRCSTTQIMRNEN